MIKKFISFFTSFILITGMLFNINVFANENQGITYEGFKKAQDDGYIGKEITYEEWNNIILLNNKLEQSLENSGNFDKIYDSSKSNKSIPNLEKGDILITNGTSSFGLTGHSAIAIGSDSILHIQGIGYEPDVKNRSWFESKYIDDFNDWIKIYRPKNSNYGIKAAEWAKNTYQNSSATYEINKDLYSTNKTYCSKIVWQAYRFGANTPDAFVEFWDGLENGMVNPYDFKEAIIGPYALDTMIDTNYISKVS